MYRYKVKISYLVGGERVTKYVIGFYSSAAEAAEEVRQEYADAPGTRVEKVWVDIGTWWESNEVEQKTVEKGGKMMEKREILAELSAIVAELEYKGTRMATSALQGGRDMKVAYASGAGAAYLDSASRIRKALEIMGDHPDLENPVP